MEAGVERARSEAKSPSVLEADGRENEATESPVLLENDKGRKQAGTPVFKIL